MIEYFPSDYRAARRAFIDACEHEGVDVIARVHPTAQGRDGKPLFLDTAIIGPRDAKKALLLMSATHGVEGYFGSGVQTGLMREGLVGIACRPTPRSCCCTRSIPMASPGISRVNEDNADINRNFVNFADPPPNDAYDALAEYIAPSRYRPRCDESRERQAHRIS